MNNGTDFKAEAKQSLQNQQGTSKLAITQRTTLQVVKAQLGKDEVKKRFEEILKERAPQFIASITSLIASRTDFNDVEPNSIIGSSLIAATFDLPINPQLGFAHLVPYYDGRKKQKICQFQMGWKGYKQLAIRTSQYKFINSTDVREGELKKYNRLKGEYEFEFIEDERIRETKKIIGYFNYFELISGYQSTFFRTEEQLYAHAKKYAPAYKNDLKNGTKYSKWSIPEEAPFMMLKTVTKLNLANNGILSVELKQAFIVDQATPVETDDGITYEYGDTEIEEADITHEVPEGKTETKESVKKEENSEAANTTNPMWWIKQINEITNDIHLKNFKKKYKKDMEMFSGTDAQAINEAIIQKEESFKK